MDQFAKAGAAMKELERRGHKAVLRNEIRHYSRGVWLFRHCTLNPEFGYLSRDNESAVRLGDRVERLEAIRDEYYFAKDQEIQQWARSGHRRRLDALKIAYVGEMKRHTLVDHATAAQELVSASLRRR